jgi:hypothetical protein
MMLTEAEIERRMTEAADAEEQGEYRKAAGLYDRLAKAIQAQNAHHPRVLDAYEGLARSIRKGTRPGNSQW